MREGEAIGVIGLRRTEPVPFSEGQIELLKTFSDQAVTAIENARLFDEVQAKTRDLTEALEHQTATSEVLSAISRSPTEVQPVFDAIARSATELCGATSGGVDRFDGELIHLASHYNWSPEALRAMGEIYPATPSRGFASARSILTRSVVHIPDISKDPEYTGTPVIEVGFRSVLAVPMLRDGQPIGSIALVRLEPRPFTDRQITLLQTFAEQAVIAVNNVRLFDEVQAKTRDLEESLQQQTATADVLKVISRSAFDLRAVFDALISSAVNLIGAAHGTIYVRDGENFPIRAHFGVSERFVDFLVENPPAPGMGSASGRVMLTGKVVVIPDILEDKDYAHPANELNRTRSILAVPLLRNDRVEGVLVIAQKEPGAFSSRQIELVQTFADQAVIAIENARLFDEVQARTRDLTEALQQQTATADVLKVISRSAFDLDMVLKTLADSARSLSGATGVLVLLRDGEVARLRAESGCTPQHREYVAAHPFRPGRETVTGRVLITGEAVHIPDVLADPEYEYGVGPRVGNYRATFGAPLTRNGKVDGVFTLLRPEPGAFTPRQIELVRTFADQAVIAIENARLFDEVQAKTRDLEESLQQQTATADVLKVISRSAFDLPAVLRTLVESAAKLCDADKATITREINGVYYRAESYGFSEGFMDQIRNIPVAPERGSITGLAMQEGKAIQVEDVEADPEYWPKNFAKRGELRTGLGIPMMRNGAPIGALALMRTKVRPFNAKQIELVQTFADQAVIAIENARLFEEVRARTREVEEALERQTATADILKVIASSPTDARPVFEAIATSANTLVGGFSATVLRFVGDTIHLAAFTPTNPTTDAPLIASFPRPLAEFPPFVLVRDGETIQFADTEADHVPLGTRELGRLRGFRSVLFAPLMSKSAAIGTISVTRKEPGAFAAHHVQLLTTFADQAVIAIENVRLFDEVQAKTRDLEEALQQQTATADVLKVISRSAFDLQAVFDTLISSAVELSGSHSGAICVRDGEIFRYRASSGPGASAELHNYLVEHPATRGRGSVVGRAVLSRQVEEIPDLREDAEYSVPISSHGNAARALLGVPLLGKERVEGAIVLTRLEPGGFPSRQIEILQTFADQAIIAIENARLFDEVQARTGELSASLDDLRKAQDRLVQSEKLASLGQLTAGIAHEIKNPLNFISNYSALSRELVDELAEAIKGATVEEATRNEADELIRAIGGNLDKVVQHGKRADSIVKNMLLHSREGSGERSITNVNAMVEEALNLAYHGARAEKPGFNVAIVKSLDPNAGAAEVYAQEMTRVLLNLIGNGFYATARRKQRDNAYEPMITASTRDRGRNVEIAIRDNGIGISDEVKAKMFNPFFTTKPAGEGTGLGLSLSHDIVLKQHGGTIDVSTEPGAFTQFTILLPRGAAGP